MIETILFLLIAPPALAVGVLVAIFVVGLVKAALEAMT